MIQVGKRHLTVKCLAILATVISEPGFADSFLCAAERANGFVYHQENNTWEAFDFPVEDKQYLVSRTDADDLFSKALKYDYEIMDVDSQQPIIHCKAVKLTDSNEETGLILCRGSYGASFSFDKRNGRYVRSQPTGYVTKKTSSESGNGPYLEIGNCSPK